MQTGSENLSNQLEEPDDYKQDSDDTVKQYLSKCRIWTSITA